MISRTHDEFLSTLPARGATVFDETYTPDIPISIHAPREGSDDRVLAVAQQGRNKFLSTLPARGATQVLFAERSKAAYFYPRSPRGERPFA